MLNDALFRRLQGIVGPSHVFRSKAHGELYSYDASQAKGLPGWVVFPGDARQTADVVRAAYQAGIPFLPRGFGTNLSGGTVLAHGGLVVCMSRLNKILGIHPQRRCAVVQPGVTNLELQNALAEMGFFYAPDPASQRVATLGGNVGENSGGPRCLKYGVTTNHVLGLEAVLADGRIVRLGGDALDPAGYDLRGIVVGSEGTLAIATEITVRILPKAETVVTMLAIYDAIADAARSVSAIIASGMVPATLEMIDAPVIRAVEDSYACGYPRDAAAVLIIEIEGPAAGLGEQALRIQELCSRNNCRRIRQAKDDEERNRLWEGRRGAFGAVARLAPNFLVNDCTVPRTRLPEALERVAEVTRKYGFEHGNVFHAGDGNMHPLIFFDSRDADQVRRVHAAGWEIMTACVALGGTISGEHGVGVEKLEAMRLLFSETDLDMQRRLKTAFDPENRLNPGKAIPPPETAVPQAHAAATEAFCGTAEEQLLAAHIREAAAGRQGILPLGRGTCGDFGNLSAKPLKIIDSRAMDNVIDDDPANLVITVGAGMILSRLQEHLAVNHQWLPLRPPLSLTEHSLGGVVALGACGPERLAYGAPRDLLLGLRFIDSRGESILCGGKVVKNVAGYDMTRLMAGSAGTLGFITQVTLRVAMLPERWVSLAGEGTLEACAAAAAAILRSNIDPVFIAALPAAAGESGPGTAGWTLLCGCEGFGRVVDDQLARIAGLYREMGLGRPVPKAYDLYEGCFLEAYGHMRRLPFVLRVDLPPDAVAGFMEELAGPRAALPCVLDWGCGRIWLAMEDLGDKDWLRLCDLAASHKGHVALVQASEAFKQRHDVFGPPRPEWRVMHRIKAELDPQHIFSPGRLPGRV